MWSYQYPSLILPLLCRIPVPLDRTCGQEQWSASPRVIVLVYVWSLVRNSSPWSSRENLPTSNLGHGNWAPINFNLLCLGCRVCPRSRSWVGPAVGAPVPLAIPTQITVERDETGWEASPPYMKPML